MSTIDRSRIELIGGCTKDGAYGLGSGMPWPKGKAGLPGDMVRFKKITEAAAPGKFNLLVGGRVTIETMSGHDFGESRQLVSVSRSHQPGMWEETAIGTIGGIVRVSSFDEVLEFASTPSGERYVDKVIFIGGEACWEYGFSCAGKAHITLADKDCFGPEFTRLKIPLHLMAEANGFRRIDDNEPIKNPEAWAQTYHFMDYVHV